MKTHSIVYRVELILSSLTADGKRKTTTTEASYNDVFERGYLNGRDF